MLLQQLNRNDPEKVWVAVQNASGAIVSAHQMLCWRFEAAASSLGNAAGVPATSNLALFAGVADAELAINGYGLAQAYGARDSIAINVGAASISAAGLILGPANGLSSAQSNGRSFALGPIALFDNDLSGPGYARGFIRAL